MPATLLDSQFAALEPPGPDEAPITVGIEESPDAIVAAVAARLDIPADDVCG
jgi:gluconokinase